MLGISFAHDFDYGILYGEETNIAITATKSAMSSVSCVRKFIAIVLDLEKAEKRVV